jgi:hypothetical protein
MNYIIKSRRRNRYGFFSQKMLIFRTFSRSSSSKTILPDNISKIKTGKISSFYKPERNYTIRAFLNEIENHSYLLMNPSLIEIEKINFSRNETPIVSLPPSDIVDHFIFSLLFPRNQNDQILILENFIMKKIKANLLDFDKILQLAISICSLLKNHEEIRNNELFNLLISQIKDKIAKEIGFYKNLDLIEKGYVTMIFTFTENKSVLFDKDYELVYLQELNLWSLEQLMHKLCKRMKMERNKFVLNNDNGSFSIKIKDTNIFLEFLEAKAMEEGSNKRNWLRKANLNYIETIIKGELVNIFYLKKEENKNLMENEIEIAYLLEKHLKSLLNN